MLRCQFCGNFPPSSGSTTAFNCITTLHILYYATSRIDVCILQEPSGKNQTKCFASAPGAPRAALPGADAEPRPPGAAAPRGPRGRQQHGAPGIFCTKVFVMKKWKKMEKDSILMKKVQNAPAILLPSSSSRSISATSARST